MGIGTSGMSDSDTFNSAIHIEFIAADLTLHNSPITPLLQVKIPNIYISRKNEGKM